MYQPCVSGVESEEGLDYPTTEKLGVCNEAAEAWKAGVIDAYEQVIAESQTIIAENDISDPDKAQILSLYCAMPLWIVNLWKEQGMSCKAIADLCTSLHSVAPVGLRINAEIIDRDLAIDLLRRDGIPCKTGKYAPHAIIMP